MPIPVIIFIAVVGIVTLALPLFAWGARAGGKLSKTAFALSWAPFLMFLLGPLVAMLSRRQPPTRGAAALTAVLQLVGAVAAVIVGGAKGAPLVVRVLAFLGAMGLFLVMAFAAIGAAMLLPP